MSMLRWLHVVLCCIALPLQILLNVSMWDDTVTYDYFCGNPLMGAWLAWFVFTLIVGMILVPGGIWALWHRDRRISIFYAASTLFYLLSIAVTLVAV